MATAADVLFWTKFTVTDYAGNDSGDAELTRTGRRTDCRSWCSSSCACTDEKII